MKPSVMALLEANTDSKLFHSVNELWLTWFPILIFPDRGFRQVLQPGGLWLFSIPLSLLQAGTEVISQTDAERLSEPP